MKALTLPRDLYARIVADARRTPNVEICGLLAGRGGCCTAVYPVLNVAPTPTVAFFMDPQSQIEAMLAMDRDDETLLGIYHSHPRTPALPSERDVAGAAYPGVAYLIISLEEPARVDVAAFSFEAGQFAPMRLATG